MKKIVFLLTNLFFACYSSTTIAQSTEILPGTVLPQMTTAQRTAMSYPVNGSLIFDTTTQSYWYKKDGGWVELPKGGSTSNYWQLSGAAGNEIANTNSGGFWSKNPTPVDLSGNPLPDAPVEEPGTRLMWIANRSAFRAGTISESGKWSSANIGASSVAMGYNPVASDNVSIALGYDVNSTGLASVATGYNTTASNTVATAMGNSTTASGFSSFAIGYNTTASGSKSIAMGYLTTADGEQSIALGSKVNTNGNGGSLIIGDSDPENEGTSTNFNNDQFVARFNNGYYFMTSGNANPRTGAYMYYGQTAWNGISDSTRKERFVKADGEVFLSKLRSLRLGSWNYKGIKSAKPERFYGPMAQELFSAFGKDKYGTIGTDTTVSTINMDGLLFIFSQALEKRTTDLQTENQQLKSEMLAMKEEARTLKKLIQQLDARLVSIELQDGKAISQSSKMKVSLSKKDEIVTDK